MVTLVKHEWHSVDSQFAYELEEDILAEIYPELKKRELKKRMKEIESGEYDLEQLFEDADEQGVDIEWDRQYDDWWSDRKGGYDVTYEVGDETSWVHDEPPTPHTHSCTHCKWTGDRWSTNTVHLREDGTVIEDFWSGNEEAFEIKDICPMCDSDTELTEYGIEQKKERDRIIKELEEYEDEEEIETEYMDPQEALEELKKEFDKLMAKEDKKKSP